MPHRLTITILLLATGCSDSARVERISAEAVRQQAAQNTEMAKLNREVAEATERLVEADAAARRDVLAAQQGLQEQQESVNEQRDALEGERRTIAATRRWESLLAPVLLTVGTGLLCLLPLAVAWRAMSSSEDANEAELSQLLVSELTHDGPLGLATTTSTQALEGPEDGSD